MFNFALLPQSPFRIIADGARLFKSTLSKIWLWQLLWLLPVFILLVQNPNISLENHTSAHNLSALGEILLPIATLIATLIFFFGYCFNLHRLYSLVTHAGSTGKESLKLCCKKFLPALGATLLILVCYLAAIAIPGALIYGIYYSLSKTLAIGVGVLLLIPMIYVLIVLPFLLMYYLQALLLDNYKAVSAIKQSCRLVRGNWWRNFIIYMLVVVIETIITNISSFLASAFFPHSWLVCLVISLAVLSVLYPWVYSILLVQYNDLKLRHTRPIQAG